MKIYIIAILMTGFLTVTGLDLSFLKKERDTAQEIFESHIDHFRLFQTEVDSLCKLIAESQNQPDLPVLRKQIKETRYAFKRIEFLFDYLQPQYNHLFINGAPLPKIGEEYRSGELVEPNGLQTLDELIFSEEATAQTAHLEKLAAELKKSIDYIAKIHLYSKVTDQQIIEALRSGVVRVFTLGLTGFDTPGSGNAIQEAIVSIQAMEKAFLHYSEKVKPRARWKFQEIKMLYHKAQQFLASNDDFDTFDRMAFLKQIIDPLYGKLWDFQRLNGIATAPISDHAQNYASRNLLDEDFLSTDYYAKFSLQSLANPLAIALGKTLFYDPILSKDLTMSCATCHDPARAFTDGLPKSKTNIDGVFTQRNAPTLIDAGYSARYFWDLREYDLERQISHVVDDSLEFNIGFGEIVKRLNQSATYVEMFEKAYQDVAKRPIYHRSISNALAAYVNSLRSFNSEFDRYARNETPIYPEAAVRGFNLFMGKAACGTCHFAPVFNGSVPPFYTESESEVLGITLGLDTINPQKDPDPGRMKNNLKREAFPHFENSFKTVTIRNAALTAPYMHNGLFNTLEEVMEFYDRGGGGGMGLDIENQTLPTTPLNLTEQEKADIIAFLHTLTDTTGLTNSQVTLPVFEQHPEWNDRGR